MFTKILSYAGVAVIACLLYAPPAKAQCLSYPIEFSERIRQSESILLGMVVSRHSYADAGGNIFTANKVKVEAWIKNHRSQDEIYVITVGGVLDGIAQISFPAVQLDQGSSYFLMLEKNNTVADDKTLRISSPGIIQAFPYADAQGAWLFQRGRYHDLHAEGALSESELLQRVYSISGLQAKTPGGADFVARNYEARSTGTADVVSFGPNPTNGGTVNPADYLTITGSGFGAAPGTVEFRNADNGGSTFIAPPNASDYVSWSDNTIVVKVPSGQTETNEARNAGTGTFIVNGTMSSPQALVVNYSHLSINSNFSGFSTRTRQRYYLRNMDGQGGYSFVYNTGFESNTAAVAAFERALNTWKCSTRINWRSAGNTISGYGPDGENVVLFDASLPAGVLARATSRFSGSATGTCSLQNTVWWLQEIDVQVRPVGTGITWQFGPALATGSQYDFETVLLHELGHAHGLGHRIAPGQLMHYAVGNATNIRTPAAQEIQGGVDKMAYSTTPTCFNPSGSGTQMIAATACSLPLKLVSFTGSLRPFGALLSWKTENEVNTDRFEVQRSSDGTNFTTIGSVAAKGGPGLQSGYSFTDAALKQGLNYYRLKIIDKDGSVEYSAIVILKLDAAVQPISIYPNPVKNRLQLVSATETEVNLVDATGKLVRKWQLKPGNNIFDVGNVSSGIYYLVELSQGSRIKILVAR